MNKAILMGRLTKDPELRYTSANNTANCKFTLAVDRRYTRQGEEKKTDFFPIITWRKTAEFCGKWFQKGMQVVVIGSIENRSWDDNEGKKHYITEVIADEAYFAEGKRSVSDPSGRVSDSQGAGMGNDSFPVDEDDQLPF